MIGTTDYTDYTDLNPSARGTYRRLPKIIYQHVIHNLNIEQRMMKERKKGISNIERRMSNVEGWSTKGAVFFRITIWREAPPSFDIRHSLFFIRYSWRGKIIPWPEEVIPGAEKSFLAGRSHPSTPTSQLLNFSSSLFSRLFAYLRGLFSQQPSMMPRLHPKWMKTNTNGLRSI